MTQGWVELHRHLDVSLRSATLLEFAQADERVPGSTSLTSFEDDLFLRTPLRDLHAVLAKFTLFQKVLRTPERLERVAFEAAEDCYREGTRAVEFRFSPGFVAEGGGLAWPEILAGFERGIARARAAYPDLHVGLIGIATRDYGAEEAARLVEFVLAHRASFVGIDLAGNEDQYPCRLFEAAFAPARKADIPLTIHAGEASGPENMWEAIELLGARRIGHGIACVRDPKLMEELRKRSICLEMCPTSNWITHAVPSLARHPLPQVLRAGIPVCINTDDPGIFGVSLTHEREIARTQLGLTEAEVLDCNQNAKKHLFSVARI